MTKKKYNDFDYNNNYLSVAQIIDMAISAEYESSPQQTLTVLSDREQSK